MPRSYQFGFLQYPVPSLIGLHVALLNARQNHLLMGPELVLSHRRWAIPIRIVRHPSLMGLGLALSHRRWDAAR